MQYGTFTTIDTPTKQIQPALAYLKSEFAKIGGYVRRVSNPHDFGHYPSFEIDYPEDLEFVDDEDCGCGESTCEDCNAINAKDTWHDKANTIEEAYNTKFEKYL